MTSSQETSAPLRFVVVNDLGDLIRGPFETQANAEKHSRALNACRTLANPVGYRVELRR